jgi:hypothetical protein
MNVRKFVLAASAALGLLLLAQPSWGSQPSESVPRPSASSSPCVEPLGPSAEACDCEAACCAPRCRSLNVFADYLYLRPRNAGLEYAVPINGPISAGAVPIQAGRTASLDPQYQSGFRIGGGWDYDCGCTTISASFTHYENNVDDAISVDAPIVLRSMVVHPSSRDAATDWLNATAHEYMRFQFADLDYRHIFYSTECSKVNYLIGVRYANLRQEFNSQFEPIITENVDSHVNFDGGGFRLGLEGVRGSECGGLFVYGKAAASFIGGEFRAEYLQSSATNPTVAMTDWNEARLVTILEAEVGVGWTGCNGHVRSSIGYMVNGWLNAVKTPEYIAAVQANGYHGPDKIDGNGLVFDGFVAHLEFRR